MKANGYGDAEKTAELHQYIKTFKRNSELPDLIKIHINILNTAQRSRMGEYLKIHFSWISTKNIISFLYNL